MTGRHLSAVPDGIPKKKFDKDIAATIERAVLTVRFHASRAMPGPWQSWPAGGGHAEIVTAATTGLTVGIAPPPIDDVGWSITPGTADHIALWSPELVAHIATWLENLHHRMTVDGYGWSPAEESHAYLIAKQILGGAG